MKKFARLSLVAAVAVAGMTTANAKDLSEAIKNTDISGTIVYRYDDRKNDDTSDANNYTRNSYKIATTLKSKVNDNVTANVKAIIGGGDTDMAKLSTGGHDSQAAFALTQANFAVKAGAVTVIAGKQALGTPFTVAADGAGNENTGTGALALAKVGPVTLAGGYFNNQNIDTSAETAVKALFKGDENLAVAAAMAKVGPVAVDAWYLDAEDVFSVWTVGAKAKVSGIAVDARHTALEQEAGTDHSLTKVGLKAKFGIVGAAVAYGFTGEDGGLVAVDNDAKAAFQGWGLNLNGVADSSLLKTNVNVDVMKGLNVAANYNMLTRDDVANSDAVEYYGQVTYKMSKNFMTYVRFGQVDKDSLTDKGTRGRLHVQYSF